MPPLPTGHRLLRTAELLSIGSELTVGETRDTNAGDLARDLTLRGVEVVRMTALPDDEPLVAATFRSALDRADLVVSTGGLGPTPDDLTREAIAAAVGETPAADPGIEAWLRGLYDRRGLPYPAANTKQAWLIPSATAIPNDGGTAPGWWVDRPDGRVVVALPGPPRELRPMWHDWVVPRLASRGIGTATTVLTLRLTGIGESAIADRLGPLLARDREPLVATYARADAVDIRISARDGDGSVEGDDSAAARVTATEAEIRTRLGEHVWATGSTTWAEAVRTELDRLGWRLASVEAGTRGAVTALLGEGLADRLVLADVRVQATVTELPSLATGARAAAAAEVGLAVLARPYRGDTAVTIVVALPGGVRRERRIAFLDGPQGRARAAINAAAVLLTALRASS